VVLLTVVGVNPKVCCACFDYLSRGGFFCLGLGFCFDSLNCGGMKDLSNVGIIDLK